MSYTNNQFPQKYFKLHQAHLAIDAEEAYLKCKMVIKSCKTIEQLKVAEKYVELWKIQYSNFRVFCGRLNELLDKQEMDIIYIAKLRTRNVKRRNISD